MVTEVSYAADGLGNTFDLVPKMTDKATPSGLVHTNSTLNASSAYTIFDDSAAATWITDFSRSTAIEQMRWVSYDFLTDEQVNTYTITPASNSYVNWAPTTWVLEGYDGTGWKIVDTQSQAPVWQAGVKQEFTVDTPGSYPSYRLRFTGSSNYSNVTTISLAELELIGPFRPRLLVGEPIISEGHQNDGTVSTRQTVTLTSGTLTADAASGLTVNKLPAGLTASVARTSNYVLTITFLGQASGVGVQTDITDATVTLDKSKVIGLGGIGNAPADVISPPFTFSVFDVDFVPKMTKNQTGFEQTLTNATMNLSLSYKVFDDDINSYQTVNLAEDPVNGIWIEYEFTAPEKIEKYTMTPPSNSYVKWAPVTWLLEAYDGTGWKVIDTVNVWPKWKAGQKLEFVVDTPGTYKRYRFRFTGANGESGNTSVSVAEIEMNGLYNPRLLLNESVISEGYANDGSVSQTQVVTLSSGTFAADMSSGVLVEKLPEGLQVSVNRLNDRQLSLAYSGVAKQFGSAQDITNAKVVVNASGVLRTGTASGPGSNVTSAPFTFSVNDLDSMPKMTSNTTPSGILSSNTTINQTEVFKIFDDSPTTGFTMDYPVGSTDGRYIEIEFPAEKRITKYTLTPPSDTAFANTPITWEVKASNGGNWTSISTPEVVTTWKQGVKREFAIHNPNYYRKYRLHFKPYNGYENTKNISIQEAELTAAAPPPTLTVSTPVIPEADENDGSISVTQSVYMKNGTFMADMSTGVTINPLPTGLGVEVTRMSDTELKLTFTGKATAHQAADSISQASVSIDKTKIDGAAFGVTTSDFFSFSFRDPFVAVPDVPRASSLSFDGVDDTMTAQNVAVNTTPGAKNTVEFWVYWDGKNAVMPFSWEDTYDLEFVSNSFGFNTGQDNLLGVPADKMLNTWTHVAAVFYNGVPSPSTVQLYLNGEKQVLTHRLSETSISSRQVSPMIRFGHFKGGSFYNFRGKLSELRIWNHARTRTQIQTYVNTTLTGQETGLVGYWKLGALSTYQAFDSSRYGNTATGVLFVTAKLNPQAAEVLSDSVKINWTPHSSADDYIFKRDGLTVGRSVYGSGFTDTGLSPGTTYTYSVQAANQTGESMPEKLVVTTPAAVDVPAPTESSQPTILTETDVTRTDPVSPDSDPQSQ
ncbi:LamG-like jellyroll fold domain-containing protein [Brevibacillus dissolubilis]|uniref:LamG-like jellyroll fold domain-containing protein n=1 Tax=Brevibacillus dissolubilis TaxID=1844116 RepID=UPI0011170314|nr:LamG-like jellyroll fold domain-containing protein [Brevibacillus dissolubilis]